MKNLIFLLCCISLLAFSCNKGGTSTAIKSVDKLVNFEDSVSYNLGLQISEFYKRAGIDIAPNQLIKAIKDGQAGNAMMTTQDVEAYMQKFDREFRGRQQQQKPITDADPLKTVNMDTVSYCLGTSVTEVVGKADLKINTDAIYQACQDFYAEGKTPLLDKASQQQVNVKFSQIVQEATAKETMEANKELIAAGEKYLAENGAKEGVVTLPNGLQYKIIQDATGPKPTATNTVKVHYAGRLIDGSEFDSSIKRGTPSEFPLNRVIQGWTQGIQLMSPGAKYQFTIPYQLAYGINGKPGSIPPAATLIFDVELLEIL